MYTRVTRAIREVNTHQIILLETLMSSNMGVYTGIEPVTLADGTRDPLQAYAPHGYDLVVDTPDVGQGSADRVSLIFNRHGESAERLGMPMIVGEWGAYGNNTQSETAAHHIARLFEELLCGDTYWDYHKNIEEATYWKALQRPIPQRISGTLHAYHFDPEAITFTCSWKEDRESTASNVFYIPDYFGASPTIKMSGDYELRPTGSEGSANQYLVVPPSRESGLRSVAVHTN